MIIYEYSSFQHQQRIIMQIQMRSLSTYLSDKNIVVTLHHEPDSAGAYRLRIWSGPSFGSVRNGLFDTDGANDLLLLEITSSNREALECEAGPRSFLTGKIKSSEHDGYSRLDVWK